MRVWLPQGSDLGQRRHENGRGRERGESDHLQDYSVDNCGQRERQSFAQAVVAGDLGDTNRKSRKEHGGHQNRVSSPQHDWHGGLRLALCVCWFL